MALENVVFQQDPLNNAFKDLYTAFGAQAPSWSSSIYDDLGLPEHTKLTPFWPDTFVGTQNFPAGSSSSSSPTISAPANKRKRRRIRSCKNKEEVENQRMTHIAVERNRRKQMNEYLSVLRSLMPPSYVQRGDQASTIGGAINYVKELEHILHAQEARKCKVAPFSDFLSFPQYSDESVGDVEVTMVESHANMKMRLKKKPKQLLKMVAAFEALRLVTVHLNVTTAAAGDNDAGDSQMTLYSISVKAEEGCELTTADDIAAAANHILKTINEELRAFN